MTMAAWRGGIVVAFLATAWGQGVPQEPALRRFDVVVYTATAGGVAAAVAAAREGKTVLLLEPGKHVGGMTSGGLGATDAGSRAAIGGTAREFYDRVKGYYTQKYGANAEQTRACSDGFHFEPHVAEQLLRQMLEEAKVEVKFGQRLDTVTKAGARITAVKMLSGESYAAGVFIDAGYEGDLMARAGVKYHVGREGKGQYGESLAGVQARSPFHQWSVKVSPLDASGKLLPFVQPGPVGEPGTGDKKVQAYNYRLCMTDRKDNQVPWPRPANYDPARYELLARYLAAKPGLKVSQVMNPVRMPNGKTDTNNNGPFSTDHIGANWDYPEADYATREKIAQDHVEYVQGFCYFLANDPRVPKPLQEEMNRWGLAKDEFTDTNNWPHQLYIREARRMIGAMVMTQRDLMDERTKPDSVGLGAYNADSHHVQRVATPDGGVINEGDFQVGVKPYAIAYRALTPKAEACENLLVPVSLSASHAAYGSIRMEPVFMTLGQASGIAAVLALDGKTTVQAVSIKTLQAKLLAQKAILDPTKIPVPKPPRKLDAAKLEGVVVDDEEAELTGNWLRSQSSSPFVGTGYRHDDNTGKGQLKARFVPTLPTEGNYEVRLYFPPASNRATNVPVVVHALNGDQTVRVNQRQTPKGAVYVKLGVFAFAAGQAGWLEVRTDGTDGHVIADAVQFVAVP